MSVMAEDQGRRLACPVRSVSETTGRGTGRAAAVFQRHTGKVTPWIYGVDLPPPGVDGRRGEGDRLAAVSASGLCRSRYR
jgi:hypothetical protein